jgi:hypothetical protein
MITYCDALKIAEQLGCNDLPIFHQIRSANIAYDNSIYIGVIIPNEDTVTLCELTLNGDIVVKLNTGQGWLMNNLLPCVFDSLFANDPWTFIGWKVRKN